MHMGVRHGPRSRGARARTVPGAGAATLPAGWWVGHPGPEARPSPGRPLLDTAPPPQAWGGEGRSQIPALHLGVYTSPPAFFRMGCVEEHGDGPPDPQGAGGPPPRCVQGSPQDRSCSSLARPACLIGPQQAWRTVLSHRCASGPRAGCEGWAAHVWGSVDPAVCDGCSRRPLGPKTAMGSAHVNGDGSVTGSPEALT